MITGDFCKTESYWNINYILPIVFVGHKEEKIKCILALYFSHGMMISKDVK